MMLLELRLIGVPEVTLDHQPVIFARRGSIALLAYLAVSRRAYPRESLATLLAGDSSDDQARKYLSNVLVDLRQHIGAYVSASRQTVVFDRTLPYRLDVEQFHVQLNDALNHEAVTDLESAMDLYRGEFLAGLALAGAPDFDIWLFAQREELRGRYMQALHAEVESSVRRGAWSSGIAPARRLIAEEPWLEEAHRELMVMLAHTGQRQAAIAQYHACRRVLREELDVEPMPETTALFKRMRAAMSPPQHNLEPATRPIVGRHEELQLLSALLTDPDCRLVTLAGMGGSGKTRLALEVAWAFASPLVTPAEQPFADGIFLVTPDSQEFLGESAGRAVLVAIARALGLPVSAATKELRDLLAAHMKSSGMLLVLDNLDGLRAGASEIELLLQKCPYVKVLVTSRSPLHLQLERVLHVDGLGLPATPEDVDCADASALFLQEAARVQVGFTVPEAQRPYLVELCRHVAGLPLALLLAARWAPVLPCSEMVHELSNGLDVLASTEQDLPERHRSVRGILDSTLAQLSTEERALAQRLAEFSPDAPALVDDGANRTSADMLAALRVLSDKALVSVDSARGTARLHPLLYCYVRGSRRGLRDTIRV